LGGLGGSEGLEYPEGHVKSGRFVRSEMSGKILKVCKVQKVGKGLIIVRSAIKLQKAIYTFCDLVFSVVDHRKSDQ
jgi:hypothetical protein